MYFLLHYLGMNTAMLSSAQNSTVTEKITYLLDNVLNNKEMILTVVAFTLTIVIVYMIRRMSVDHAWTIAVVAGAVADAIVLLTGSLILGAVSYTHLHIPLKFHTFIPLCIFRNPALQDSPPPLCYIQMGMTDKPPSCPSFVKV